MEKINFLTFQMISRRAYVVNQSLELDSTVAPTSLLIIANIPSWVHLKYLANQSFRQDLSMHAKTLTPMSMTLTLTPESAFSFQNLCLGF